MKIAMKQKKYLIRKVPDLVGRNKNVSSIDKKTPSFSLAGFFVVVAVNLAKERKRKRKDGMHKKGRKEIATNERGDRVRLTLCFPRMKHARSVPALSRDTSLERDAILQNYVKGHPHAPV